VAVLIEVKGAREAAAAVNRLAAGARAAGGFRAFVGSHLPYGYGIETGQHAGGRLARRAGGAWMLTRALQSITPALPGQIAAGLARGPGGAEQALRAAAFEVKQRAAAATPVDTGALRASITVSERGR
jgi:hypothetical protein